MYTPGMTRVRAICRLWIGVLILFTGALAGCGTIPIPFLGASPASPEPTPTPSTLVGELTFVGSTTVQPLVEKLGKAYTNKYSNVNLNIAAGGSVAGIQAVQNGEVDIGMASRELRPGEQTDGMNVHTLAIDVLAIIVHPSNPVKNLTQEQLRAIYEGKITNWRKVGGKNLEILPVVREVTSGTRGAFDEIVLDGNEPTEDADVQITASEVEARVAATENAIGYVGFGHLVPGEVKVLTIDAVPPSPETALDGSYKLKRPLLLLTGPLSRDLADTFIDFALSAEGQQLVVEDGWVPAAGATPVANTDSSEPTTEATPAANMDTSEPTASPLALAGKLTFVGSTTVQPLVEKLGEVYSTRHPDVNLNIAAGGSVAGIQAVQNGEVDIGMASRELRPGEQTDGMNVHTLAIDVLAIIVHPSNPVQNLTQEELRDIYEGKITNWREVGGDDLEILPVVREVTSGTRGAFDEIVLDGNEPTEDADVQITASEVEARVAATENAIGYVGFGHLVPGEVKVLTIDAVPPSPETALDGSYKLKRPLLLLTGPLSRDLADTFIDFALSVEGQQLVAEDGWVPAAGAAPVVNTDNPEPTAEATPAANTDNPEPTASPLALAGKLTFVGSTTVQPLVEKLGEVYSTRYPDVNLNIAAGGTVAGIQAVQNGEVDIGMASRELRPGEQTDGMNVHTLAIDVLAIIVHPSNPVKNLTQEELRDIYEGKITNWREVGGDDLEILPVVREVTSGTRGAFDEIVLDGNEPTEDADVQITASEVEARVATTENAIGYVGFGHLVPGEVKVLTIDAVPPSPETALDGSYKLKRPLLLLTGPLSRDLANTFIDFALSAEGQQLVLEDGWVPAAGATPATNTDNAEPTAEATPAANTNTSEPTASPLALVGRLTFFGSTTVQPLVEKLGEAYTARYPDVNLNIAAGGSVTGIQAVQNGEVDIGMASRELLPGEQTDGMNVYTLAIDVLAIIVHPSNPVKNLTQEELRDIYEGKITNWREVGGKNLEILPIVREVTSGTRGAFDEIVLDGNEPTEDADVQITASEVEAQVAAKEDAIGYVGFGHLVPSEVKVLPIDGVLPNPETTLDGSYKLKRPLLLLTGPLSRDLADTFIDFALSVEGQQLVAEDGWPPAAEATPADTDETSPYRSDS